MTTFYTQSVDITFPGTNVDALPFNTDDETYTIASYVVVASDPGFDAVSSGYITSSLINYGSLFSPNLYGAAFENYRASVSNEETGSIAGGDSGLYMDNNGGAIVNRGSITGYTFAGVFLSIGADNISLENFGSIYGHQDGIADESENSGAGIFNAGSIRGEESGIFIFTEPTLTTVVTNTATGIIKGPPGYGILIDAGMFSLTNHGMVIGGIHDTAGLNDVVINTGKIQGPVDLGGGNDLFNGKGGTSGSVLGGDGNDRLIGGSHNDRLHGGDGNDNLTGGPGADRFFFDTSLDAVTNVDRITDFTPAQHDKIVLSETYFAGLGPHGMLAAGLFQIGLTATAAPNSIIYTPGNGFLYYHSDDGTTHFATLATHPVIHAADFIVVA